MTKKECAIVMAYTGVCMLQGDDLKIFYDYISKVLGGRPIWTHELPALADQIKEGSWHDFLNLCSTATEDTEKKICHIFRGQGTNDNEPITGYKELDDALNSIPSDELDTMLKAESEKRNDKLNKMTEEESDKILSNHEFSNAIAEAALNTLGIDLNKEVPK